MRVNFCSETTKPVILENARKRGWTHVSTSDDWNIFWGQQKDCRKFFSKNSPRILNDCQMINHFPNSFVITRKDFLSRCIKKYRKLLHRIREKGTELEREHFKYANMKIIPTTYVLPEDYVGFLEEYEGTTESTWILKPSCSSKGHGIFLTKSISKLKRWSEDFKNTPLEATANNDSYVISKYINNPLLIGGKKFDLRLYVLVTSYNPLKAYLFKHGFCRFCTYKYDKSTATLKNRYVHLTNVSVQKRGKKYNKRHGGKWPINNLRLYLESTKGSFRTDRLFDQIKWLIIHSLKAAKFVISSDRHCFECYGYDIIIDSKLKPWLIEINGSPSLKVTTNNDRILKSKLIDNVFSVILPPNGYPNAWWNKIPSKKHLKDFERLIDEDLIKSEKLKNIDSFFKENNK